MTGHVTWGRSGVGAWVNDRWRSHAANTGSMRSSLYRSHWRIRARVLSVYLPTWILCGFHVHSLPTRLAHAPRLLICFFVFVTTWIFHTIHPVLVAAETGSPAGAAPGSLVMSR